MNAITIDKLLRDKLGLELTSVGKTAIKSAVKARMRVLHVDDIASYAKALESSAQELNELVEEVVIPETWFFRNTHPFIVATSFVAKKLATNGNSFIKLLSAPCSSGEEAYSLAIALFEAGIPADRFSVQGIDISTRALERARNGIYRENSFREKDLRLQYKYFQNDNSQYILNATIKNKVRFSHGNILDPHFMQGLGMFDVLFCRNVLIYLDAQSRMRAQANINNLLNRDGILFVGHAESGLLDRSLFRAAPYPKAFAFHRSGTEDKKVSHEPAADNRQKLSYHKSLIAGSYRYSTTSRAKPAAAGAFPVQDRNTGTENGLHIVRQLVEKKRFAEAESLLKKFLRINSISANAYYLLGLVKVESEKIKEGKKLLHKSVYLEPDHVEALGLLALLAERAGDFARAKIFEQRIQRLKQND
jgi:chemotaxis protein methyltransferase WspC